ncbi:tetratricopeptide repeat protein [Nitrosomonas mobilis]|uniref:Sel1 domain protein repeat-containing protein n=1 Tax=Nitrosomonas mobilis TaxID=51642 RepID=A0A1G5SCC8_9PROT|nr:tetratricopeptide repeat protein [Nitrosomonas mobilis]SCZ84768.1 Sel1 domain protein repeat-containing protein [Nitrosomonas mobilis]
MPYLIPTILIALMMTACGNSENASTPDTSKGTQQSTLNEITPLGELPSFLKQGLSAEEQDALKKEIIPTLDDGMTPEERFKKLRMDAEAGDPDAQNGLGTMFYLGEAVSRDAAGNIMESDPVTAAGWFSRAAEQGHADAQFNLGLLYLNGEGVAQNTSTAVKWFTRSAEQGNVDAQNNLGVIYLTGEGGATQDKDLAIEWFRKAAKQGNEEAKQNLEAIQAQ